MRYLITGGAGFVGSHLTEALLARGDEVTVIDDLSTGSLRNLASVRDHPRLRLVIDGMTKPGILEQLVADADAVYHLAAAVGVKLIVESPLRCIESNIGCTELLLRVAAQDGPKVLLTSTSEVYGKSKDIPFREDGDLVLGPTTCGRWSYAYSKAIDEFLALAYWKEKQLPTVVARLFNTVGPRQTGQHGMVIPRLVSQALGGEPVTVYGDGTQSRCFTHVSDAVRGLIGLMDTDACVGSVYNIGGTEEVSMLGLARMIVELTGSSSPIVLVPYAKAYAGEFEDMPRRVPSTERVHQAIGWKAETSLRGILEAVIESLGQPLVSAA
jgi:UDP-glucose 4-epimerase